MRELNIYGVRVFHAEAGDHQGVMGLPRDFSALKDDQFLIVGAPANDVVQWALSEAGFTRLTLLHYPAGEGSRGVMSLFTQVCA
ncbi:MAG: hypothetical protein ABL897_05810 [Hyphomicrobium sp.]